MIVRSRRTLITVVAFFLAAKATARDETIVVSRLHGFIRSPAYDECVSVHNQTFLTWEFPITNNLIYLNIEELSISKCDKVTLFIKDSIKQTPYCKRDKQLYDVYSSSVQVRFQTNSDYCKDKFQIRFAYINSAIDVLPGKFASVNKKVTYRTALHRVPLEMMSPTCIFYYGDGTQSDTWETTTNSLSYSFAFPGWHEYRCVCQVMDVSLTVKGSVKVEANLTDPPLNLWYTNEPQTYLDDVILRFDHIYTYPVYYYLSVRRGIYDVRTVGKYNKHKFIGKSPVTALFDLKPMSQKRLGPGRHRFTFTMENNISCTRQNLFFTLNKALEEMRVVTSQYVGIHPDPFNINITFGKGAPADIGITVRERSTSHAVTSLRAACHEDCSFLQVKATVPKPAVDYIVEAVASNSVSSTKAVYGPFTATPYVYDVHVTSPSNFRVGPENILLVFIRAGIGDYTLSLISGEKQRHLSFSVRKQSYDHKINFNFPANVQRYTSIGTKLPFRKSGYQEVTVVVTNIRRSVTIKRTLHVLAATSCDHCSARIRDGNSLFWTEEALKVGADAVFSADAVSACDSDVSLRFDWSIFRVESNEQLPLDINKEVFYADNTQPDIVLEQGRLPVGLYVMKLVVTTFDVTSKHAVGEAKDFTLFEISKRKINFVIKGGSKREIGINVKTIELETSFPASKRFYIQWFCARTAEDLPYDVELGRLTRRGSCFGWSHPLYVSGATVLRLPTTNFTVGAHYHIRAFAGQSGYEVGYADQEIVLVSNQAPLMELRCFANCERPLLPQLPLILQLDCPDCDSYRWVLHRHRHTKILEACANSEFCKLDAETLQSLSREESNHLAVTGSNRLGSAIVTLELPLKSIPSRGRCITTPPSAIAYVIEFNVVCSGFRDENNGSLIFKFFLMDEEKQNPLLQHGYDNELKHVMLSPSSTYEATILVKICNVIKACAIVRVKTYVSPRKLPEDFGGDFAVAVKSRNLQRMVQTIASFPVAFQLRQPAVNIALKELSLHKLISMEGAKQICDVLSYVTANARLIDWNSMDTLWRTLSRIQQFVQGHLQNDDINFLVQSCAATASNVIQTRRLNATLKEKTSRFAAFGNFMMTSVMPEERPATFAKAGMKASFFRLHRNGLKTGKMSHLTISNLNAIHTGDVINVEVHDYDASIINFDTPRRKVDFVTSVFITSGLNNPKPVSSLNAQQLQSSFVLPPEKVSSSTINLYVGSDSGNVTSYGQAVGSNYVTININPKENSHGALLKIAIKNPSKNIEEMSIVLTNKEDASFILEKKFPRKVELFDWLLPVQELLLGSSSSSYKLTAHANLSSSFNTEYGVLEAELFVYLVNCLYWDDVMEDWNDEDCKPISNKTSAIMTCKCYRFPVVRPHRGPKGVMKGDLLPTLFGSRLEMFPSATIKLTCLHGMFNPLVVVAVMAVAALSIPLCQWAQKVDKLHARKNDVIELMDNSPFEKYRYVITLHTGWRPSSGTTARVALRLGGTRRKSKVHIIQSAETTMLTRGSVQSFLMTTSQRIGDIKSVRLWINDNGLSPNWKLNRIAVKDVDTNQCWFFICNQWITPSKEFMFMSGTEEEHRDDKASLSVVVGNPLLDRHLWLSSIFMGPWQRRSLSRFRRISMCVLDLFLVMLPCSYLHFHWISAPDDHCRDTAHFAMIGILGGALSFPILCCFRLLFCIRLRRKQKQEKCPEVQQSESSLEENPPNDAEVNNTKKQDSVNHRSKQPKAMSVLSNIDEECFDKGESVDSGKNNKKKKVNKQVARLISQTSDPTVMDSHLESFSDFKPPSLDAIPEDAVASHTATSRGFAASKASSHKESDALSRAAPWEKQSRPDSRWGSNNDVTSNSTLTDSLFQADTTSSSSSSSSDLTDQSSLRTIIERSKAQTNGKLSRWTMLPYLSTDGTKSVTTGQTSTPTSMDFRKKSTTEYSEDASTLMTKPRLKRKFEYPSESHGRVSTPSQNQSHEEAMTLNCSQSSCATSTSSTIKNSKDFPESVKGSQSLGSFDKYSLKQVKDPITSSDHEESRSEVSGSKRPFSPGGSKRRLPSKPSHVEGVGSRRVTHSQRKFMLKPFAAAQRLRSANQEGDAARSEDRRSLLSKNKTSQRSNNSSPRRSKSSNPNPQRCESAMSQQTEITIIKRSESTSPHRSKIASSERNDNSQRSKDSSQQRKKTISSRQKMKPHRKKEEKSEGTKSNADNKSGSTYHTSPQVLPQEKRFQEKSLVEPKAKTFEFKPILKHVNRSMSVTEMESPSDFDSFRQCLSPCQARRRLPSQPGFSKSDFSFKSPSKQPRKAAKSKEDASSDSSDNCLSESHWETIHENLKLKPRIRKDIAFHCTRNQTFKTTATKPRDRSSGKKTTESMLSKSVTFPCFTSEYDSHTANDDCRKSSSSFQSNRRSRGRTPNLALGTPLKVRTARSQGLNDQSREISGEALRGYEGKDCPENARAKSPDPNSDDIELKMEDNARNLRKLYLIRKLNARKKKFQKKSSPSTSDRESEDRRSKLSPILGKQITKKRKFVSEDTLKKLSMSSDEVIEYWLKNTPNYYNRNVLRITPASSVEVVCSDLSLNSFYTAESTETEKSTATNLASDLKLFPSAGYNGSDWRERTHHPRPPEGGRRGLIVDDPPPKKELYSPKIMVFTTWLMMIFAGFLCCAGTIVYGMTFDLPKSTRWLASVMIGYVETILCLETLLVITCSLVVALIDPAVVPRDWTPVLDKPVLQRVVADPEAEQRRIENLRRSNPCYTSPRTNSDEAEKA